jgi:DNA polymerase IV
MQSGRFIVHVDMDAFFAAIEQRDNPQYCGRPVIVGADPKGGKGRGVVSTCSYEARKFGVHSAMPISMAYRKCPHAVFLPVDMEKYIRVWHGIRKILYDFTPDIEPVSIDEAFLDISGSFHLFGTPLKTCLLIKSSIKDRTNLTASVGLAPTKMAAKIASDLKKPDGMVEVTQEGLLDFLWPLEVRRIWGLGQKGVSVLNDMGIKTIGDLAKRGLREMIGVFGKNGEEFWKLANGIDQRGVEGEGQTKSISNEVTFDKDTADKDKIEEALMWLCEKVSGRLRKETLKARTITLKIRLEGFDTYTRAITLDSATNFTDVFSREIKRLYNSFDKRTRRVRLVGVRASNLLTSGFKDSLFDDKSDDKIEDIHKAIDKIKQRFGDDSVHRAGSHRSFSD